MIEPHTGNARISGSMASLCGLEKALKKKNENEIQFALKRINLQHSVILSLGGLPMIYSGDEIGLPNNYDYLKDESKKLDNRWLHRSKMDWSLTKNIAESSSAQALVYMQLKKLITIRKKTKAFADTNDLVYIDCTNSHLLVYKKTSLDGEVIYVIVNFSEHDTFFEWDIFEYLKENKMYNLLTDKYMNLKNRNFIGAYDVLWLRE